MTPLEQLCEKMRREQSTYCLWLTAQPPEEILNHSYEYCIREDIIMGMEEITLTSAQMQALLDSPSPLADIYNDFFKIETDHMQTLENCIEKRARTLVEQNPGLSPKVYKETWDYAYQHDEYPEYNESNRLNRACRNEIDAAIAECYDGVRMDPGVVEQVVERFGLERTRYVVAAAIQCEEYDARIAASNRKWAAKVRPVKDLDDSGRDRATRYATGSAHTGLLNNFAFCVQEYKPSKKHSAYNKNTPER